MHVATTLALAASVALFSFSFSPDAVARHRPIPCADLTMHRPYSEEAVYNGVGDPNSAASFSCKKLD